MCDSSEGIRDCRIHQVIPSVQNGINLLRSQKKKWDLPLILYLRYYCTHRIGPEFDSEYFDGV